MFETLYEIKKNNLRDYVQGYEDRDAILLNVNVARPESRGEIKLKSKNPRDHLYINSNYLEQDKDVQVAMEGWDI